MWTLVVAFILCFMTVTSEMEPELKSAQLPTLYEYYTNGGIVSGLNADQEYFLLNQRNVTIFSGAMHYFRVPRAYWRDRLRKIRAAGLNTVETYVPWNLHEPLPGVYDFGSGGTDMQEFLDVETFCQLAKEEDLFVIVRPGPYICAEWEFGGFPSWLLNENGIKVRTSDEKYMKHVERYFNTLIPMLARHQFTKGGTIIAVQVENEYGSLKTPTFTPDKIYLAKLRDLLIKNGIVELLVTSDSQSSFKNYGAIEGALQTSNFGYNKVEKELNALRKYQQGRPFMVMEYWDGWFDHWAEEHHYQKNITDDLIRIIRYPSSFNLYMFHGGTNFGFLNGANVVAISQGNSGYQPTITSYDYAAPLTENGDYTPTYDMVYNVLQSENKIKTRLPDRPELLPRKAYESVNITCHITLEDILNQVSVKVNSENVVNMEALPINNMTGQQYGYVVYRKTGLDIKPNSVLKIEGNIYDSVMVLINGKLITKPLAFVKDLDNFGYWRLKNGSLVLPNVDVKNATIDLVVTNWGRVNYGKLQNFNQRKGLWEGDVLLNDSVLKKWIIFPLEFRKNWVTSLTSWQSVQSKTATTGPGLYKAVLTVDGTPEDTFIATGDWNTGFVIVNGFNLGRYCHLGPQRFLYLPAPLLKAGENEILIFEHFETPIQVKFSAKQIFT